MTYTFLKMAIKDDNQTYIKEVVWINRSFPGFRKVSWVLDSEDMPIEKVGKGEKGIRIRFEKK